MVQASTEFVKSGYSEEDSAVLAQMAAMYQNIADEEISAGDSASFIIAQMKAFNIEAQDSVHIIDAVNEVANNYAVSSADLANNLGKVSSTLAVTGTSFEEALGMLTGITEITRNASTASRGLKQISSRLTQTLDESSSTGQKLKDIYSGLGIALLDGEGQIRSTYDILKDLAEVWNTLSTNEQEYIALTSAGSNQVQNFTALMSNFGHVVDATATAENSAGSAARENATYMESLEAKVQGLKAAWQELVTEGGTINKFIKLLLDAGTAVLKFADSDIGRLIIKLTALGTAFSITSWGKDARAGIQLFTEGLKGAITKAGGLKAVLATLPEMLNPAVAAAVMLLGTLAAIAVINYPSTERLNKTLQNNNEKLAEYNSKIEELESLERQLEPYEQARLARLKEQTAEIEKQNAKLVEQLQQRALEQTNVTGKSDTVGGGMGFTLERESTLSHAKQNLEEAQSIEDLDEVTKNYIDTVVDLAEQAENSGVALDGQLQSVLDLYNAIPDVSNATEDLGYDTKEMAQNFANMGNSALGSESSLNSLSNTLSKENMQLLSNISSIGDLINAETKLRNGQKLTEQEISNLMHKYDNLQPYENAIRNGELAAAEAIHQVGIQSFNTSKTVIANSKAEAEQMVKDARKEVEALAAIAKAQAARHGSMGSFQSNELAEARRNLAAAEAALNAYNSAVYYGTAVETNNTGATGSNTSAKDKNTEAENKLRDAISSTTDALKDQTEAVKNAADYMRDRIDEQIDALENTKDAIDEYYDEWIDSIRDANDELEDQLELEEALQALAEAKSKKVRVYQDGGFVYQTETQGVAEAQKRVSDIQRKQQQEDLINTLEEARKKELASIDKQIDAWEAEKKTWEDAAKSYDDYLAKQTLGIDQEGKNWSKRLGQAKQYADNYIQLMQAIATLDAEGATQTTVDKAKAVSKQVGTNIKNMPTSTSGLKSKVDTKSPVYSYTPASSVISTSESGNIVLNVANVTLPDVTNPTEFIADLQDYARYASQSATKR